MTKYYQVSQTMVGRGFNHAAIAEAEAKQDFFYIKEISEEQSKYARWGCGNFKVTETTIEEIINNYDSSG